MFELLGRVHVLRMPVGEESTILPSRISPLKGLKTMIRNSTSIGRLIDGFRRYDPCLDCNGILHTINIHKPIKIPNQPIRSTEKVVKADTQADLLNYLSLYG